MTNKTPIILICLDCGYEDEAELFDTYDDTELKTKFGNVPELPNVLVKCPDVGCFSENIEVMNCD